MPVDHRYWQQMLEAVHTIHEERIVHGDLKPANFLFVQAIHGPHPQLMCSPCTAHA